MLLITIDLISANSGLNMGTWKAELYNDATGTHSRGNYVLKVYRKGENFGGRVWRAATVQDFPRKSLSAWDLLFRALRGAVGERNR